MALIDDKAAQTLPVSGARGSRLWIAVLVLLVAAFVATRVAFLDSDLPPWKVAQLQPIDEFFYTVPAFNLYHYGAMDHRVVAFIPTDGAPLNLLENVMTAGTLLLFGNNYYGLRMASVLAGLMVLVIVYLLLRREAPLRHAPTTLWLALVVPSLLAAYLVADFAFDTAARVAEPSIFQMLAMSGVLFMFSRWPEGGGIRALLLGFVAVCACLFVYVYNFYIVPAVLLTILVESMRGGLRRIVVQMAWAFVGCAAAVLSYAAVVYITYGQSLLDLYQSTIQPFGGRVGSTTLHGNLFLVFSTNIFRFDLPLLVAFGVALPVFAYRIFKERNTFGFLVAALLLFLVLQTEASSDTTYRKLVLLIPLVVLVISMAVGFASAFTAFISRHRVALAATLLWAASAEYLIFIVTNQERANLEPGVRRLSQVFAAILVACLVAAYVGRGRYARSLTAIGMAAIILPGVYLSAAQLYVNPTYRYRDAMVAAAPLLDDRVTAGGFSLAFRLYNTSIPVLNPYQYSYDSSKQKVYESDLRRLIAENIAGYVVARGGSSPLLTDMGLHSVAEYEIDAEGTPVVAAFGR